MLIPMEYASSSSSAENGGEIWRHRSCRMTSVAGFGVGISISVLLLLTRAASIKPLSLTIGFTTDALKTTRAVLRPTALSSLLYASKTLLKLKATALKPRHPATAKRLKAAQSAASLISYAVIHKLGGVPGPAPLLSFAAIRNGYRLTKNFAKVAEGFLGFKLDKGVRNAVDAVGLVVKGAVIAREVWVCVAGAVVEQRDHRCRLCGGGREFRGAVFRTTVTSSSGVRPTWKVRHFSGDCGAEVAAAPVSGLLTLSIPVSEIVKI